MKLPRGAALALTGLAALGLTLAASYAANVSGLRSGPPNPVVAGIKTQAPTRSPHSSIATAAPAATLTTPPPTPTPSASTSPAAPSVPAPLAGRVIALDPGHSATGGSNRQVPDGRGRTKACNTSGTATADGYPEYAFTLDVAQRLARLLEAQGALVVMTRDADDAAQVCVDQRGTFSQDQGAELMVSIHGDGTDNPAVKGFHVIVSNPPLNQAQGEPSVRLAQDLVQAMTAAGFIPNPAFRDGLSPRSDIAGVSLATTPVVMIELGEMKNPEEAAIMSSPDGRQRYAQALFNGLVKYLG